MMCVTTEVTVFKPDSTALAKTLKEQGFQPVWDGLVLLLTRDPAVPYYPHMDPNFEGIVAPGTTTGPFEPALGSALPILGDQKEFSPRTFRMRDANSLEDDIAKQLGLFPQERVLVKVVSPIERARSPQLLKFQADLSNAWNDLAPWSAEIPSAPALSSFSLPVNFAKRVAVPLSDLLDQVADAEANLRTAPKRLQEAHRIQDEMLRRVRSGREMDSIRRGLTQGGEPGVLQHLLETGPDIINALGLCHQALGVAGFHSDQPQFGCVRTRLLDRGVRATSDLDALLDMLDTVLEVIGAGTDYMERLRVAQNLDDDGLRAWATATGGFFMNRALSAGLAALSGYLCVIPLVGPILGPLVALFSGALASRLLAPLPS